MSATIKVLVPEATRNYIQNPSFRYDTTGWSAVGCNASRVLTYALYGIAALMVITAGLALREGVYYRVSSLAGISEPVTISAYVRGNGTVHLRLIEEFGNEWVSDPVALYDDRWTRIEVSGYLTGSSDARLYVETDGDPRAITFYVDGCQMERKSYATTFCDGDQPGCQWNIMDSASEATRDAYTRLGGRWVTLVAPCDSSSDIYATVMSGFGMPPIQNNVQPWALSPGSFFQNYKVADRTMQMVFTVKNAALQMTNNPSLAKLHELRQQLIDIFKPDIPEDGDPFLLSYCDGERTLYIRARYDAGLDGDWDIRNQWVNSFPVRLIAVDPFFIEDNCHAAQVDFEDSSTTPSAMFRVDGRWVRPNGGTGGSIADIEIGKYGQVWAAGTFTGVNWSISAIHPLLAAQRIAYWNGTEWFPIMPGLDGTVHDLAVAPNGDVYVTGLFTTAGGVPASRIARWNGTAWSALGTGLNGDGYHVTVAPNGDVYVGGNFSQAGGIAVNNIARWDGLQWRSLGALIGLNGAVYSIAISKSGDEVYVGGAFTDQYGIVGTGLSRVAKYNPVTNLFSATGNGFDDAVLEVDLSPSGVLYAVGDFLNSGTEEMNHIAKWNGSIWTALGDGISGGTIFSLDIDDMEKIIVVGSFDQAGSVPAHRIALWNGSNWTNIDLIRSTSGVYLPKVVRFVDDDIYLAGDYTGTTSQSLFSGITTVNNRGTANVKPLIYIYGPGELRWIENQTTHKTMYLNLNILDNEEVVIDFGAGKITSLIRGDLSYAILPGSDFADFYLAPGNNTLAVFMSDSVDSLMYLYYRPRHWSADATMNADPLP